MGNDAVIALLLDWAEWQRAYWPAIGYPPRSIGMSGDCVVTENSSDEQQDDAKKIRCRIVDQCIDDLQEPSQRAAIHRRYLSAVYRLRDYEHSLLTAHEALAVAFKRKGILC